MFKNARTRLVEEGRIEPDTARSYHIVCLLYDVPNWLLAGSYRPSYSSALYWLRDHDLTRLPSQETSFPVRPWTGLVERKGRPNPDRRFGQAV